VPRLVGLSTRHDEIIRVTTPTIIVVPGDQTLHVLDVYAIPPEGLEGPPYPLNEDTRGLIEIRTNKNVGKSRVEFRADLRALMDAYWRFALGAMTVPEDIPDLVDRIRDRLDHLRASHGNDVAEHVAAMLKQERTPGQNLGITINSYLEVSFLRLEETGCMNDSLRPVELQLYLVRTNKLI